jgi:hypothetical protein
MHFNFVGKKTLFASGILAFSMISNAGVIADYLKGSPKTSEAANAQALNGKMDAGLKTSPVDSNAQDIPQWLKDSERLGKMLGDSADFRVENPKVIRKFDSPIPGLDGFVVEATSYSKATPDGKKDIFIFYTDKTRRYLVVGMMIDMKKDRDLNLDIERYVRGELADNPAKALRPQDMHSITIAGNPSAKPLIFVTDLGSQAGKDSFLNLVRLHSSMVKSGANPRPLRVVLVSAGHDEMATVAMSMAYGYETISGNGAAKIVEYAEKGKATPWLESGKIAKDPNIKNVLGNGIFKMEDNSTQALLAKIDTLPLVYDFDGEKTVNVPLPSSASAWKAILTKR